MKRIVLLIPMAWLVLMPQVALAQARDKSNKLNFQENCMQAIADVSSNSYRGVIAVLIVFSGTLLLGYCLMRWRRTEKQRAKEYKELKGLKA